MALFKIQKGRSDKLAINRPNATEGWAYFTTDDGKFYIDITGDGTEPAVLGVNRICLNAASANQLTVGSVGASNNPVYFDDGVPVATGEDTNKYVRFMKSDDDIYFIDVDGNILSSTLQDVVTEDSKQGVKSSGIFLALKDPSFYADGGAGTGYTGAVSYTPSIINEANVNQSLSKIDWNGAYKDTDKTYITKVISKTFSKDDVAVDDFNFDANLVITLGENTYQLPWIKESIGTTENPVWNYWFREAGDKWKEYSDTYGSYIYTNKYHISAILKEDSADSSQYILTVYYSIDIDEDLSINDFSFDLKLKEIHKIEQKYLHIATDEEVREFLGISDGEVAIQEWTYYLIGDDGKKYYLSVENERLVLTSTEGESDE